jgi:TM2 domain-containing membrane protein YozV
MKQWLTNIAQKALDLFVKFASTKAITALKDGFVLSMPATLVGSIFLLLANLPIPGYADFMAGHFGDNWNIGLNQINNATFSILAIIIAVGIGYSYARNERMDGISCGILTLISFLIVSPSTLTVTSDTIKALGDKTAEVSGVLPDGVGGWQRHHLRHYHGPDWLLGVHHLHQKEYPHQDAGCRAGGRFERILCNDPRVLHHALFRSDLSGVQDLRWCFAH